MLDSNQIKSVSGSHMNPVFRCFLHFWDNGYYFIFRNIHYIDFDGVEHYYTLHDFPGALEKKVKLLNYFMNYMKEHLLKAGADIQVMQVVYYSLSSNCFLGKDSTVGIWDMAIIILETFEIQVFWRSVFKW